MPSAKEAHIGTQAGTGTGVIKAPINGATQQLMLLPRRFEGTGCEQARLCTHDMMSSLVGPNFLMSALRAFSVSAYRVSSSRKR